MKRLAVFLLALLANSAAFAQIVTSLPFTLTNGTVADATQAMADFNQIVNNTNSNAAHNGANSDITSLLGLTTALSYSLGGSSTYIGTGGGTANAQTVSSLTPGTGFTYVVGKTVTWVASASNTAAMTLNVNGLGLKNVFTRTIAGTATTAGGEVKSGALVSATYDGTQFVLNDPNNTVRLDSLGSLQGGIAVPTPQGRLTPTCGTPVIVADASAVTSVCYDPYNGNLVSIYNGTYFQVFSFSELTLNIANAGYTANSVFDVFAFLDPATNIVTIGTGPAWTTAGNYVRTTVLTTGTAARSTALTRVNGLLVNTGGSMTARNGATTYTVPTQRATYLGSIWIDAAAQATTCQVTYGQNRTCGVWNMYNRVPMRLKAGDPTASWTRNGVLRASNGTVANSVTMLIGFAEENAMVAFKQLTQVSFGTTNSQIGIGDASSTVASGLSVSMPGGAGGAGVNLLNLAEWRPVAPPLGLSAYVAEEASTGGSITLFGTEASMLLTVDWRG